MILTIVFCATQGQKYKMLVGKVSPTPSDCLRSQKIVLRRNRHKEDTNINKADISCEISASARQKSPAERWTFSYIGGIIEIKAVKKMVRQEMENRSQMESG